MDLVRAVAGGLDQSARSARSGVVLEVAWWVKLIGAWQERRLPEVMRRMMFVLIIRRASNVSGKLGRSWLNLWPKAWCSVIAPKVRGIGPGARVSRPTAWWIGRLSCCTGWGRRLVGLWQPGAVDIILGMALSTRCNNGTVNVSRNIQGKGGRLVLPRHRRLIMGG